MKRIPLTQGMEALVDDEDYDYLMQWKWHYTKRGEAATKGGRKLMHRVVAGRTGLNMSSDIDHEDRNKLNNRRKNLRPATKAENGRNRGPNRNNTSGFKGVWFHKQISRWRATIKVNWKRHNLGTFTTPEDAARAYDDAAKKHFGEFAYLNFP
jgi:hypothetical protein